LKALCAIGTYKNKNVTLLNIYYYFMMLIIFNMIRIDVMKSRAILRLKLKGVPMARPDKSPGQLFPNPSKFTVHTGEQGVQIV
jgi:hypothetical protein